MPLSLLTNVPALNASRNLNLSNQATATSQERLASGTRLNHAVDDPSSFAISGLRDANVRSTRQAANNAGQAANMLNVSDSALGSISDMISRLRELGVQAASDTVDDGGRDAIGIEAKGLREEINRTANAATFNGKQLLNGQGGNLDFQVGTSNTPLDRLTYAGKNFNASSDALGLNDLDFSSSSSAGNGLDVLDNAMNKVSNMQSNLGAFQNRLSSAQDQATGNADIGAANLSFLRDTDYAAESTKLAKNNIQQQAATAVLSQANQTPGQALKLLDIK